MAVLLRFRAWDKKLKEMFGVSFIDYDTKLIGLNIDLEVIIFDFDDVILMQSTGFFDKKGQEIFEGDIIDTTDYEGGLSSVGNPLVKVESDKYGFIVTGDFPGSPITLKEFEDGRKFAGVKVKIIGNVYQNPELLEVNHDRD